MALISREKLPELLQEIRQGRNTPLYLIFGERFLCQQAAGQIEDALLDGKGGTVHPVDGSMEDPQVTLGRLRTFSLLPGRQIYRVNDTRLFLSKTNNATLWNKAAKAHGEDRPGEAVRWLHALLHTAGLDPQDPENSLAAMPAASWSKVLGMDRPDGDLSWADGLLGEHPPSSPATATSRDPAALLEEALTEGIPDNNVLLLLTEELDKRKKIFKLLSERQTVINCSVDSGSSSSAQKAQKSVLQELLDTTLRRHGKTLDAGVLEPFLERVGFHPVAAVMEMEKLILGTGSLKRISRTDLDDLVGRTRQEAVFELTEALGKRQTERCLLVVRRLRDNGIHPLAMIATLRNFARTLLLFRALQEQPEYAYQADMPPALFQSRCLPLLKAGGRWQKELSGHPYALYMQFKTASQFGLQRLATWLDLLLAAEMRLKSSSVDETLIMDHLLFFMGQE